MDLKEFCGYEHFPGSAFFGTVFFLVHFGPVRLALAFEVLYGKVALTRVALENGELVELGFGVNVVDW